MGYYILFAKGLGDELPRSVGGEADNGRYDEDPDGVP
jgi:hypothetical protein